MKEVLARFGESVTGSPKGASVRLSGGDAQLAEVVRALDAEGIRRGAPAAARARRSTTSSSPRPAARSRAADEQPRGGRRPEPAKPWRCDRGVAQRSVRPTAGRHARPALGGAHAAPAGDGGARRSSSRSSSLSINSSGLDSATRLPGFPTDSYFDFALAISFVQGALFSANSAGTNMASDIESGFLNRLSLTPLRRVALMMGQLAGILALGLIQALDVPARRCGVRIRHRGGARRRAS